MSASKRHKSEWSDPEPGQNGYRAPRSVIHHGALLQIVAPGHLYEPPGEQQVKVGEVIHVAIFMERHKTGLEVDRLEQLAVLVPVALCDRVENRLVGRNLVRNYPGDCAAPVDGRRRGEWRVIGDLRAERRLVWRGHNQHPAVGDL